MPFQLYPCSPVDLCILYPSVLCHVYLYPVSCIQYSCRPMYPASLYHVSFIPFIPISCIVYIVSCTLYPCNLVFQKLCIPVFVYPCIACIILFLDPCICYTVYSSIPLSCVLYPRTHVSRVLSCPVNPVSCNSIFLIPVSIYPVSYVHVYFYS